MLRGILLLFAVTSVLFAEQNKYTKTKNFSDAQELNPEVIPLSKSAIRKILVYLPYFSTNQSFGCWVKNTKSGLPVGPYIKYADGVNNFLTTLNETKFLIVFDWVKWDGHLLLGNIKYIKQSDLLTLRKLMTYILRRERMCDGVLLNAIKDGSIKAILERLQEII